MKEVAFLLGAFGAVLNGKMKGEWLSKASVSQKRIPRSRHSGGEQPGVRLAALGAAKALSAAAAERGAGERARRG